MRWFFFFAEYVNVFIISALTVTAVLRRLNARPSRAGQIAGPSTWQPRHRMPLGVAIIPSS